MRLTLNTATRIFRVVLGCTLIGLGIRYHGWWGAFGLMPLFTAAINWCPFCLPGTRSCGLPKLHK